MADFTLSKQNAITGLSSRKHCAGYWVETSTLGNAAGFSINTPAQDPMHTASFYKGFGN